MDLTSLIKEQLPDLLKDKIELPEDQKDNILTGLGDSLIGGLKQTAGGNFDLNGISSLLQGGENKTEEITTNVQNFFETNVASKLGLSSSITQSITSALPGIVSAITSKISSGEGFDLSSITKELTGDNNSGGGFLSSIMNIVKKFMGSK